MTRHQTWLLAPFLAALAACGSSVDRPSPSEYVEHDLRSISVTIEVDSEEFEAVLERLSEQTGRPIRATADALERVKAPVRGLHLTDVSLETVLNLVASVGDGVIWVPEGGGALFDLRSKHPNRMEVQIFSLADLCAGLGGASRGPVMVHEDVADEENPLFDAEDELLDFDIEEVIQHLRAVVGTSDAWDPPAFLRSQGEQTLVVRNTPTVLRDMAAAVEAWRAARSDPDER